MPQSMPSIRVSGEDRFIQQRANSLGIKAKTNDIGGRISRQLHVVVVAING